MIFTKRKTIGVFVGNMDNAFTDDFFADLDREVGRLDEDAVIFLSDGCVGLRSEYAAQEMNFLRYVPFDLLDGIIALPFSYKTDASRIFLCETIQKQAKCPVVLVGTDSEDGLRPEDPDLGTRALALLDRKMRDKTEEEETSFPTAAPVSGLSPVLSPADRLAAMEQLCRDQDAAMTALCVALGECSDLTELHRVIASNYTDHAILRDHYIWLFGSSEKLMEEAGNEACLVHAVRDHTDAGMPMLTFDRSALLPPMAARESEAQVFYVKLLHQAGHSFGFSILQYDHGRVPSRSFMQTNVMLSNTLESIRRQQELLALYEERRLTSITDHMTGLLNRRGLLESVEPIWKNMIGREIAFVGIDMDYLKHTNDNFGHAAGDIAISLIGRAIRQSLPEGAFGSRTGGDEFIVFLPDAGNGKASQFSRDFHRNLEELTQAENRSFPVSASVGYAVIRPRSGTTIEECIKASDQVLYQVKENRPNKIVQSGWNQWRVQQMPVPFGTASSTLPYYAKPCNERLASIPEGLMKLAEGGYIWEHSYVAGKPDYALTLMDYPNIYSFIHTHDLDADAVRQVLSDASLMVHRKAFTQEEIDLLLGDDQAKVMAHFASPSTIVLGEKGYSEKWMYDHASSTWKSEGITPGMVIETLPYYYNPLFVKKAADAFSRKLYNYTGMVVPVKWNQWNAGDIRPDGSREEEKIPEKSVMLDVMEFCQFSDYPTGCESVSLYMLLRFYNVEVTIDQILDLLPMGAQPYDTPSGIRYGGNPEREFVGDPRKEISYGVFNGPVAQVAEQILPGVKTKTGASLQEIRDILDSGNPVMAWYLSAPMRPVMYRWSWMDDRGEMVYWPGGEHAVVICGYADNTFIYRDPNAGTTVEIDPETFERGFAEMGRRIIYYENSFPPCE